MRARDTRQQILDATQRLIETGGVIRLTTKEIAREAQCAEGTLFKHFKSKEDLCLAVVLENAPRFKDAIRNKLPGQKTVARNLEDIARAAIDFSAKLIPLGVTLLADAELLARHRNNALREGGGPREVFELLAAYIAGEQKLGRIRREVEPMSAAALLFGPCFYWAFVRHALGKSLYPIGDREFIAGLVASLMMGLCPSSRSIAGKSRRIARGRSG